MFWDSVWQGIQAFTHWQVWAALGVYMLAMIAITLIGGALFAKERVGVGMIWTFLGAPLLQLLITLVAIMTLAPILFHLGDSAAWGLPWIVIAERSWHVIKFIGTSLLFIVALGAFGFGKLPGVTEFAVAGSATASTASLLAGISPNIKASDLTLWPGLLPVIGFLVIAATVQFILMAAIAGITAAFRIDQEKNKRVFMLIGAPLSAAVMFLPTFMYAAWLAPQLARY